MSMNVPTGFGIIALVLAIAALFATGTAVWLSMAALVMATVAAALRGYPLALAAVAVVVLNTFVIDPTVWSLTSGTERAGRDRSVDAVRIILLMLTAAPVIAMAVNHVYSKLTDRLIASLAMALLAGFLGLISWHVPQGPLIVVFTVAVAMGAYDFWRELRNNRDAPAPDPPADG